MANELWRFSATELASKIAQREVSSREVVSDFLERIAAVGPAVNAVVETFPEATLAWADAADARQRSGESLGILHGVPFTIKTNIDQEGRATSEGVEKLKDLIAPSDAPPVEHMKRAGAIPLGRTNMPDFGLRVNTESSLYGATRNPFDATRTAGGSSGGEAAAIATGQSVLGLGNDLGGSLRNPAYCCGIASIKPSFGRVPTGNATALFAPPIGGQLLSVQGVLGRTVADVRRGLEAVMGSHRMDPVCVDAPLVGPAYPKRIALVPEPSGGSTDPGVAEGVRAAGRALADAGYDVVEIEPPMLFEAYFNWSEHVMRDTALLRPVLDMFMGEGGKAFLDFSNVWDEPQTPESTLEMHRLRYTVGRAWSGFLTDYAAIVGPTWTQPPFPLGWDVESQENALAVAEMFRFVCPANLLGLPAASVPTGITNGLPVGAQIISRRLREDITLDIAADIERALGTFTPIDPR